MFKNSCSRKNLIDTKSKGWQQSINWYLNSYGLMLNVFFISILKFKGKARICLRQHRILAENMLMICLHYVSKFLKWKFTVWNWVQKKIWYTKSGSNKIFPFIWNKFEINLSFHLKIVEVNESWYIATFAVSESTKSLFFHKLW